MLKQNWLKPKLAQKPYVVGTFVEIPSPQVVEILGLAGFDFVVIDCEHGAIGLEKVEDMIRAAAATDLSPLVRAPQCDPVAIRLPLDMGAVGVHVPQVESLAMARTAAASARFYPRGNRGMQPYVRGASYRTFPTAVHLQQSNDLVTNVVHIEGAGGVADMEEILALDGIDVAFLGPYDLSQAFGVPGQVDDPRIHQAIRDAVKQAGARTAIGTYADGPEAAKQWIDLGVRYVTIGLDALFLRQGAAQVLGILKPTS
jgi:4-hydroxy-2-oxoheptanedioate aldolase